MVDIRLPASGNIIIRWHASNAFAVPAKPTPTEVNAGLLLTRAVSWNDFDFGLSASTTVNDPSLAAKSNVSDRGSLTYGGSISLYLPKDFTDTSNEYKIVYDALDNARTTGWISIQIDGEASETSTPSYSGGITQTAAAGDLISLYKVMTAGYSNAITGEEAFRETISFLPQGEAYVNAIVAVTNTVVVTPSTATVAIGSTQALTATVSGRKFTRGVRWTSSNPSAVQVSQNGIVKRLAAGAADVTATYAGVTSTAAAIS